MKNSNQDDAVVRMLNQVEGLLKKERDTLRTGKPEPDLAAEEKDADWRDEVGWPDNEASGPSALDNGSPQRNADPAVVGTAAEEPERGAKAAIAPIEPSPRPVAPAPASSEAPSMSTDSTATESPAPAPPEPATPQPVPADATPAPPPEVVMPAKTTPPAEVVTSPQTTPPAEVVTSAKTTTPAEVVTSKETPSPAETGAEADDDYTGRRLTTRLGQLLLDQNLLSEGDLQKALAEQQESGKRLGGILIEGGYVAEPALLAVLVKQHGVPAADLDDLEVAPEVVEMIPAEMARRYLVVPIAVRHGAIDLAMVDPTDFVALAHLRFATGMRPNVFITTVTAAERAITHLYGGVKPAPGAMPEAEPMPDNPHEAVKKMILDRDSMLMAADEDPRKFYQLAASIDDFIDKIFRIARG